MAEPEITKLILEVSAQDATIEDIDQLTRQLLGELRELDAESVELMRAGSVPEGTKSADPVTTGAIVMAVLPNMLPKLFELVRAWAARGPGRTVKFKGKVAGQTFEFEGSSEDLQKIISSLSETKKPNI
ncbi:MAG TPA: hypothetical protein VGK00_14405 [Anaerolineales bacterium]